MKQLLTIYSLLVLTSCASVNMQLPPDFKDQSTRMQVSGMNGWMVKQKLSFGNFQTSSIRRGWDFTASVQHTKFSMRPEEFILKVFDIDTDKKRDYQRNRFQYTLNDGQRMTEIYATEKFNEKQLVYKSNNPWIGKTNRTVNYEYAFTASIIPITEKHPSAWSLVLLSKYDKSKNWKGRPVLGEEGYATNGNEHYAISPLRSETRETDAGEVRNTLGGPVFSGYEFRVDNRLVAVVDLLDNAVWMHNELKPAQQIMIASFASALLLKRIHDAAEHDVN
jgi:hypothetical protein